MFGSIVDFMLAGSIGQNPPAFVNLASIAILPAVCAGITLTSAAL